MSAPVSIFEQTIQISNKKRIQNHLNVVDKTTLGCSLTTDTLRVCFFGYLLSPREWKRRAGRTAHSLAAVLPVPGTQHAGWTDGLTPGTP